jgi:IMP dehydrogenase
MMYAEKLAVPTALTFDDVLLVPAASYVEPNDADVHSIFSKNIPLNIPLVSSAMDTVTEAGMAIAIARLGGIGVIHRNMRPERSVDEVIRVKRAEDLIEREVLSVGPEATLSEVEELMNKHGIGGVPVSEEK